jgi:hypothetical protein
MVKNRHLIATLAAILALIMLASTAQAQRQYHLEHEWVKIWINLDGTIDLFYNLTLTLDSGDDINYITVGQPKSDFTVGEAIDQYNNTLPATDASAGEDYKVKVSLHSPLRAGQTVWFTLTTNVAGMLSDDTLNPGNLGMKFIPTWYAANVNDLRVLIVLPVNVTANQVKTLANVPWNGTQQDGNRLAVYFEKSSLPPSQQYPVGVSFPKASVPDYQSQPSGLIGFLTQYGPGLLVVGIIVIVIIVFVVVARKRAYSMPTLSMETLGIRRGLTAVESSYLLDMKPTRIVTEILYSLLQKRAVWVESPTPSIKLKIMQPFEEKKGTRETPLRYYEIDFLDALKEDGTLDEERLAQTMMFLRDTVEEKLRGYRRQDTVDYYKQVVAKAWEQVEQAGTPELASNAYDEQLLWLFLDPDVQTRTQTAFRDRVFEPSPLWLWYWYGYQHYSPHPTYRPTVETLAQAAKPPTIPGADFANNVATAVENTSNNIVVNLEKFANAIVPMPAAKSSDRPAHHNADCVCACAACACACACVSCACACAGGGVGLKGDGLKP